MLDSIGFFLPLELQGKGVPQAHVGNCDIVPACYTKDWRRWMIYVHIEFYMDIYAVGITRRELWLYSGTTRVWIWWLLVIRIGEWLVFTVEFTRKFTPLELQGENCWFNSISTRGRLLAVCWSDWWKQSIRSS